MTLTLGSIMIEQTWRASNSHQQNQNLHLESSERRTRRSNNNNENNCSPNSSPTSNGLQDSSYNSTNTNTNSTCSRGGGEECHRGQMLPIVNKVMAAVTHHDGSSAISDLSSSQVQEFLPICDALFNVISLGAYFCDIVFDILTVYTFYQNGLVEASILGISFIILSLFLSQVLSVLWYKGNVKRGQEPPSSFLIPIHLCMSGVLWRYFKLFIPVDLRFIKSEVRDLILLRLVHGFCEAAPILLLQLYLICKKLPDEQISDLDIVSTSLSLFSVCWALASYSKNVRRQNVHKLVLTWLGVIFQFLWRLGTITSRMVALAVYATMYHYWLFLVLVLHWFSMLLWLISPKNTFDGEKLGKGKKIGYSAVIAIVYTFCYMNVQETPSRQKVIIFYVTMFLENSLLLSVSLIAFRYENFWFKELSISLVFGAFLGGIAFMCLYYRYFHVRKLSYATSSSSRTSHRGSSLVNDHNYSSPTSQISQFRKENQNGGPFTPEIHLQLPISGNGNENPMPISGKDKLVRTNLYNRINGHHLHHHPNVPGVFNCRFNPAIKRKKKKPSSFIPPAPVNTNVTSRLATQAPINNGNSNSQHEIIRPFWKRPLSTTPGSENEGSMGSRVDIRQKLHEKKQQQLADLREIEEEIKQGKLRRPHISEMPEPINVIRQPIPFEKKQPWFRSDPPAQLSPRPPIIIPPSDPNELLLDPHYLMYSPSGFYDQPEWNYYDEPLYQNDREFDIQSGNQFFSRRNQNSKDGIHKSYRLTSDVESQLSIPRSYTLPREFKYKRKLRKVVKNEHFLPSTNSSDGDVDSAEDDLELYSDLQNSFPLSNPTVYHVHVSHSGQIQGKRCFGSRKQKRLHETKL